MVELPEIEDGLSAIVADRRLRELHERLVLPPPLRPRGRPDFEPVMAAAKLEEAVTLEEALSWLSPKERMAVLSQPKLIASLARLKDTPDVRAIVQAANDAEPKRAG